MTALLEDSVVSLTKFQMTKVLPLVPGYWESVVGFGLTPELLSHGVDSGL